MIERIAALKGEGVLVSLCEGNHDFFLKDYFSGRLGFDVYPEWAEFTFDGLRILVSHGDTVDRGNRKYLALRGFLRSSFTRRLLRLLPLDVPLAGGPSQLGIEQGDVRRNPWTVWRISCTVLPG